MDNEGRGDCGLYVTLALLCLDPGCCFEPSGVDRTKIGRPVVYPAIARPCGLSLAHFRQSAKALILRHRRFLHALFPDVLRDVPTSVMAFVTVAAATVGNVIALRPMLSDRFLGMPPSRLTGRCAKKPADSRACSYRRCLSTSRATSGGFLSRSVLPRKRALG